MAHKCECVDYASPVLRLILGVTLLFSSTAKFKLGVSAFAAMAAGMAPYLGSLGAVYGTLVPFVELAIGVLLILGLFTKYASFVGALLFASFIIGVGIAQLPSGIPFLMEPAGAVIPNKDFAYLGMMIAIYLIGPGAYALDNKRG